jgi:DNA-binding MarR family transcriptional regulator
MVVAPDVDEIAADLHVSVGMLLRKLRQVQGDDSDLTLPQTSALARLDRHGPATSSELAKAEQISPQSMGTTLSTLEERGLIVRTADPLDGRRAVLHLSRRGLDVLRRRRGARTNQLSQALSATFSDVELRRLAAAAPLLERLAEAL